jgi:hypothetical protein
MKYNINLKMSTEIICEIKKMYGELVTFKQFSDPDLLRKKTLQR